MNYKIDSIGEDLLLDMARSACMTEHRISTVLDFARAIESEVINRMIAATPAPVDEVPARWIAGTKDGDGNPLVTILVDELRALAEFAVGPGLSAWRIDGEMVRREALSARMRVVAANALVSTPPLGGRQC